MHHHAMPNVDRSPGRLYGNSLAKCVRDDFVETVETSSEPELAHQRASEWLRAPRISHKIGLYSKLGRVPRLEAPSVERKLAAIFAADVEGYSRLMGLDEVATLRTLTAYRVIIDRLIASDLQHSGQQPRRRFRQHRRCRAMCRRGAGRYSQGE